MMASRANTQTIEERTFCAALIMLEAHFEKVRGVGYKTMGEVKKMVAQTLDKSLNKPDVRYVLYIELEGGLCRRGMRANFWFVGNILLRMWIFG